MSESKTFVISGAGGALGQVVVEAALGAGHCVHALCRHAAPSRAENLFIHQVDLGNEAETHQCLARVFDASGGQIDAAFLLAGGFAMGELAETSAEAIDKQVLLNFKTAYHVARPLFMQMCKEKKQGLLSMIGSRTGLAPETGGFALAYTLAKSMLGAFALSLASQGEPHGIRSALWVPGVIDTEANRKAMPKADRSGWTKPTVLAEAMLSLVGKPPKGIAQEDVIHRF